MTPFRRIDSFSAALIVFLFTALLYSAEALGQQKPPGDREFELRIQEIQALHEGKNKSGSENRALSAAFLDWGIALYQRKETILAEEKLTRAVELDASNGPAWFLLGDLAYLERNDFKKAELYWKRALPFAPPDKRREITERISRAAQDRALERAHTSVETDHFSVRYSGAERKEDAERVALYLEERHAELHHELGVNPGKVSVIIYPAASFDSLTKGHDEILGLYDGRIRVPEPYLNTEYEKVILSHELAHAFLQRGFTDALPVWLQEGYAQAREPVIRLSPAEAELLKQLQNKTLWIPLEYLDRRFLTPSSRQDTMLAYLQSRFVVLFLLEKSGDQFSKFLKALSSGDSIEEAFESSYSGLKWNDLNQGRGWKIPEGSSSEFLIQG